MVDTVRTLAQLITASADNTVGAYTNQNQRDFIVTVFALQATVQTASYTAVAADAGTRVLMNSASAVNFTVPPFSSVPFALNTMIEIAQKGAGQVTIVAGGGVTLRTSTGTLTTFAQYSVVSVWQETQDVWWVSGERS